MGPDFFSEITDIPPGQNECQCEIILKKAKVGIGILDQSIYFAALVSLPRTVCRENWIHP